MGRAEIGDYFFFLPDGMKPGPDAKGSASGPGEIPRGKEKTASFRKMVYGPGKKNCTAFDYLFTETGAATSQAGLPEKFPVFHNNNKEVQNEWYQQ